MNRLSTIPALLALSLLALSACDALNTGVQKAGEQSKRIVADTKKSWADVLTYTPKATPALPQTRYCYRTLTDVVCYDSVQATTSRLDGYQDGENISWVQPGGGSLGVSGGEPTAQETAEQVQVAPGLGTGKTALATEPTVSTSSGIDTLDTAPMAAPAAAKPAGSGPFYHKESPYVK